MEPETRKRILITGSAGFVGWNAVRRLLGRRHEVVATFRTLPHYLQYVDSLQPVVLDLRDGTSIAEVVARFQPDIILHFAALARPQLDRNSASLYEVNVEGSARLARTAALQDVPILYLSTDLVYPTEAGCCTELTPLDNSSENPYARSKLQGERAIQEHASRWIIIRPSLMFGTGTPRSNCFTQFLEGHWCEGRKAPVFLDQFRSILYVEDLLRAVELVTLERPSWNNIFVCGGPERVSRAEFALRYAATCGLSPDLCEPMQASELPGYQGGASDIWLDSSKLYALGWRPRSLEEAFAEMRLRGTPTVGDAL